MFIQKAQQINCYRRLWSLLTLFWCSVWILFNVKMQQSFLLHLIHFESFHIEYLAALAFLQPAVALGGRMGVVPDNAASGTITDPAPDCSLLPCCSLLLPTFDHFCMLVYLQHTNVCMLSNSCWPLSLCHRTGSVQFGLNPIVVNDLIYNGIPLDNRKLEI